MKTVVKIKRNGAFTNDDLDAVKTFLRKDAFPQFYTNSEFKTLNFVETLLIGDTSICRNVPGTQETRYNGNNPKRDELRLDITENGWQLYQRPISLRKLPDGRLVFLDGRTKDSILGELKYKNRIANIYEISDEEVETFCERLNAGEDNPPAGLMLEQDLVGMLNRQIKNNFIDLDIDDIRKSISQACGKGRFSAEKREKLAWQVFYQQIATQNNSILPRSWNGEKEVTDWLKTNNYIDVGKVIYLPYSSTSPPKAIIAAANAVIKNPGKEIRVVIYVRSLTGYDLKKAYISAILKFKAEWKRYLGELCIAYFNGTPYTDIPVKLYGCVPSNIEGLCDDMSQLIIFGKNDQKIDDTYLKINNSNLSNFFELDDNENED